MASIAILSNAIPGLALASVVGGGAYAFNQLQDIEKEDAKKREIYLLVSSKKISEQTNDDLYKTDKEKTKNYQCKLNKNISDCEIIDEITIDNSKKWIDFSEILKKKQNNDLSKERLKEENVLFLIKTNYLFARSFVAKQNTTLSVVSISSDDSDKKETNTFGEFDLVLAKSNFYFGEFNNFLAKVDTVSNDIVPKTDEYKCKLDDKSFKECQINKFTDDVQDMSKEISPRKKRDVSSSGSSVVTQVSTADSTQSNVQQPDTNVSSGSASPSSDINSAGDVTVPVVAVPTEEEVAAEAKKKEEEIKNAIIKKGQEHTYSNLEWTGKEEKLEEKPLKYSYNIINFTKDKFKNISFKGDSKIFLQDSDASKKSNSISFKKSVPLLIWTNGADKKLIILN